MTQVTVIPPRESVFQLLQPLQPEQVVTYEQLAEVLDCDAVKDRQWMRTPIYQARRRLEVEERRTIEVVQNVGYRVVQAHEHERLANGHFGRARRQVRRGQQRVTATRREELSRAERQRLDDIAIRLDQVASVMRKTVK